MRKSYGMDPPKLVSGNNQLFETAQLFLFKFYVMSLVINDMLDAFTLL